MLLSLRVFLQISSEGWKHDHMHLDASKTRWLVMDYNTSNMKRMLHKHLQPGSTKWAEFKGDHPRLESPMLCLNKPSKAKKMENISGLSVIQFNNIYKVPTQKPKASCWGGKRGQSQDTEIGKLSPKGQKRQHSKDRGMKLSGKHADNQRGRFMTWKPKRKSMFPRHRWNIHNNGAQAAALWTTSPHLKPVCYICL